MEIEKPIRSIREQIADHIRSDIFSGQLNEGDQLRETPLAERFGVSRGPVRDVLLQLSQEGLLISKTNSGVRVGSAPDKAVQPLVVDLRQRIETFALEKAIQIITDNDISFLNTLVEQLRKACQEQNLAVMTKHDMAFHQHILEIAGGKDLVSLWQPIVVRMMLHYTRHKDMMEAHREHAAILDAIRNRNTAEAIRCLLKNIQ